MPCTALALELVAPHCDIVDRLRHVPPSAGVRGLFFNNLKTQIELAGRLGAYEAYFPDDRHSAMPYYPLADFMLRLACAGALVTTPAEVHEGMRVIARGNVHAFSQTLLGRTLLRLLAREPRRLTEQGLAARRQTHRYGRWTMLEHGPSELELIYEDEYQWIESAVSGAAEGTYAACVPSVNVETRLSSRFSGSTLLRW
ncbi:MAG: hypothetical protein JWN04_42 [Myxococcaceae bacterium]|nr:hypothetical protein [Myxococcaceae bacterium]